MSKILTNQEVVLLLAKCKPFDPVRILMPNEGAAVSVVNAIERDGIVYIIPDVDNAIIAPDDIQDEIST